MFVHSTTTHQHRTNHITIKRSQGTGYVLLYDHYSGALFGIVIRILGDDQIAEDVLQKTMLKIWNGIESFDQAKASFFTWMSVIARNSIVRLASASLTSGVFLFFVKYHLF